MENSQNIDVWTDRLLPTGSEIFLDHLAYFVPDMGVSERAMSDLGFVLSPFTPQTNATDTGEPPIQVGLANRCALLERGYIEILTPHGTAKTALVDQLHAAIKRYVGIHLIAFCCVETEDQASRLAAEGFDPLPPVALQRETKSGLLRFSVLRVKPSTMPEGRIQFLTHHTPDILWQPRWMTHPNGARALTDVLLCVDDPSEAVSRFSRFTGMAGNDDPIRVTTARGRLTIVNPSIAAQLVPDLIGTPPPLIAAYAIETSDLDQARSHIVAHGLYPHEHDSNVGSFWVTGHTGLGGAILFHNSATTCPW